jgi:hypothetical protein
VNHVIYGHVNEQTLNREMKALARESGK